MAARPRCVASVRPATLPLTVALLSITLKAPKMTTMPTSMAVSSSMRLKPSSAPRRISMSRVVVVMSTAAETPPVTMFFTGLVMVPVVAFLPAWSAQTT